MAAVATAPSRTEAARPGHLPALTGLRFLLALWVILDHLTSPGMMLEVPARALPYPLYALVRGGYLAVTTFFVLSGFVLARSYSETSWNGRRFRRSPSLSVATLTPSRVIGRSSKSQISKPEKPKPGVMSAEARPPCDS